MKQYQKRYSDVYPVNVRGLRTEKIGSTFGSSGELTKRFKSFLRGAHRTIFDLMVKELWLERHFSYDGVSRKSRSSNGYIPDWSFSYFMKAIVGVSQKPITTNLCCTAISTYIDDFFPDFLRHDPFRDPKFFRYPYKNVTLDQMIFVYQVHNRLKLLEESERRSMSYAEFANWAFNWVSCYNDEMGKDVYTLHSNGYFWPFIRKSGRSFHGTSK